MAVRNIKQMIVCESEVGRMLGSMIKMPEKFTASSDS
jgi:hypothetical protein